MTNYSMYSNDLAYSKQFIFSFGSNYALGTRMFPRKVREATIIFYAFVRYADELIDNPDQKMPGQTHHTLEEFIKEWKQVVKNKQAENAHPILRSNFYLFSFYNIPFEYSFDFLEAMNQDLEKARYTNYTELEHYMWGSASVIGHIMTFIVGYTNKIAFDHARALGEAMQLANFLRDIDEDYQKRNRIYLPTNDMSIFGVTEEMIANRKMTPELRNFIAHYTERTEKLFEKGMNGIKYLKQGRFSILLAARMYRKNIRILKKRNYSIFSKPIRLTRVKKGSSLASTFVLYFLRGLQ